MYKVWIVIKREYLERVRSRAFLVSTILVPLVMGAFVVVPQKLITMKSSGVRSLVVVTTSPGFGDDLKSQLARAAADVGARKFDLTVDLNPTPAERQALTAKVLAKQLDGFVWAPDEALAARKVTYVGRSISDFIEMAALRRAINNANLRRQLAHLGLKDAEVQEAIRPLEMESVRVEPGKESRLDGTANA